MPLHDTEISVPRPYVQAVANEMSLKPNGNGSNNNHVRHEIDTLCDDFLRQSSLFASNLVRLAGLSEEVAPQVEGMILTRCAEVIAKAQVSVQCRH